MSTPQPLLVVRGSITAPDLQRLRDAGFAAVEVESLAHVALPPTYAGQSAETAFRDAAWRLLKHLQQQPRTTKYTVPELLHRWANRLLDPAKI